MILFISFLKTFFLEPWTSCCNLDHPKILSYFRLVLMFLGFQVLFSLGFIFISLDISSNKFFRKS